MAPPVTAVPGAVWDGRFASAADATPPAGSTLGALGAARRRIARGEPPARRRAAQPARAVARMDAWSRCRTSPGPMPPPARGLPLAWLPARPACGQCRSVPPSRGCATMAAHPMLSAARRPHPPGRGGRADRADRTRLPRRGGTAGLVRMSNFGRNLALWVIIALLLVVLFNLFQPGATQHRRRRRSPIPTSSTR